MDKSIKEQKNNKDFVSIDGLGRISIPSNIRKQLQIETGNKLDVYRSGRNIILKKINMKIEKITLQQLNITIDQITEISIKINDLILNKAKDTNSKHKIRTIDELGKIIIPIEERQELNIMENDKFKLYIKEDMIILIKKERKYNNVR